MAQVRGNNAVSGTWGQFWWNDILIMEVQSFEAKIVPKREDVQIGYDIDSKINGIAGEGKFTLKHMYTRGAKYYLDAWKAGRDPRTTFVAKSGDPDTVRGQEERVVIGNAWFNEMMLAQFEKGKTNEREYPFGFTASSASFYNTIEE